MASSDPQQPSDPSSSRENEPGAVTPAILQGIHDIASRYDNLKCHLCAQAIEEYLKEQNIHGKRIKLDVPYPRTKADNYIYNDNLPPESAVILENGHHEGVTVNINREEIVFDNNHPNGIPYVEWRANLMFDSQIFFEKDFNESIKSW